MSAADRFTFAALFCDLLLGFSVFATDKKRPTGRSFLLLTFTIAGWLVGIHYALEVQTAALAGFWIRFCTVCGALVMPSFGLLRISILNYRQDWKQHFWSIRWWWYFAIVLSGLELSPLFLVRVNMVPSPAGGGLVPAPVFGWVSNIEAVYIHGSLLVMAFCLIKDQFSRRVRGVQRVELQFVLLAGLALLAGVLLTPLFQRVLGDTRALQIAPVRVLTFHLIIAYGITSRGILHVRAVFRLTLSYLLLSIYIGLLFAITWFCFRAAFLYFGNDSVFAPAMCVAIVTALLFNATGTPVRRLTKRILPPEIDFERIVTDVSDMMQSVTTLEALFEQFASLLGRSFGSPLVRVLLWQTGGLGTPVLASGEKTAADLTLSDETPLVVALRNGVRDVTIEELHRRAPSPERDALLAAMEAIDADVFVPIRHQGELSGALTVAPRPSGHLYGSAGRATLALIARQLGVAIANARLYTEARQSQAYNQFLVEHLTCGVIATNPRAT